MLTVDFQSCFIFILISLICYSIFFKKPKGSRAGFDLPPSPPSLPIIGHLHLLRSAQVHKSFQKLSSKYGPLLYLRIFNAPVVLVSSGSVANEIFKAQDVNISSRGPNLFEESLFFGSSSFFNASYGDYWKFMKKLTVTKMLGPKALEQSRKYRADELERFYKNLSDKAMKKESVEIGKEATKFTNNSTCKMIMGRSCSEDNGEAQIIRSLISESFALSKKLFLAATSRGLLEKLGLSLFKKEIMSVSRGFDELLERILREHEEKPGEHHDTDMASVLLAAYRDENAQYKITKTQIKSFFVELLFAGTETSAQTIQWTMAEIINNTKIFERVREEIDFVVGETRLIQETDLPNLPYLQAVIKEGLRLHLPVPLIMRTFQERCEVKGFYIPEKTTLIFNAYAMMRDPNFWEDPDEFKPERFLASVGSEQENERREQELKYIPFGSGRRICPGANLASIFVGTTIGTMVQSFDWIIKGDTINMEEAIGGMTLNMAHPPNFTPVARTLNPLTSKLPISSF